MVEIISPLLATEIYRMRSIDSESHPSAENDNDLLFIIHHLGAGQGSGKRVDHTKALRKTWAITCSIEGDLLYADMNNLSRKNEPDPNHLHYIVIKPGVGYRSMARA